MRAKVPGSGYCRLVLRSIPNGAEDRPLLARVGRDLAVRTEVLRETLCAVKLFVCAWRVSTVRLKSGKFSTLLQVLSLPLRGVCVIFFEKRVRRVCGVHVFVSF